MNRACLRSRRGAAAVALIGVLVIVEVAVVVAVVGGGLQHDLTLQRIDTSRAFYAAEGGAAMAVQELVTGEDRDGDGVVGGISDDGNADNNFVIGGATTGVTLDEDAGLATIVATGRAGATRRRLELRLR